MFKTIVVATDASASGDRALEAGKALATESKGRVIVVHVIEVMRGRMGAQPIHANEDELKEMVRGQVEALKAAGMEAEFRVHTEPLGGPAHMIVEDAEAVGADVIVVGSSGHGPLAGVLLGSVAQRLLHIATCPVLVIPAQKK